MSMKKILVVLVLFVGLFTLSGCTEADKVSSNLSLEADNFNVVRKLTVINCITDTVQFQMTGKMSIEADTLDDQLEVVVEMEDGTYRKHFIGLGDNVDYIVEDLGSNDVSKYKYTLNFNPKMMIPFEAGIVD